MRSARLLRVLGTLGGPGTAAGVGAPSSGAVVPVSPAAGVGACPGVHAGVVDSVPGPYTASK